jgi:hypothetical protein
MKKIIFLFLLFIVRITVFSQTDSSVSPKSAVHILKFNFFSPLFGHSMLSYEKSTKPYRSKEFSFSIIGAGRNVNNKYDYFNNLIQDGKRQLGAAAGYGYKFYLQRRKYKQKNIDSPPLTGLYVKPIVYGAFFFDDGYINDNLILKKNRVLSLAVLLENGWQFILSDLISLDFYGGFGYSLVNVDFRSFAEDPDLTGAFGKNINHNQYVYTRIGRNPGLAFSGGFRIGVAFARKQKNKSLKSK